MISRLQRVLPVAVWVALYAALVLLLVWARIPDLLWLYAAWLGGLFAVVVYSRMRRRLSSARLLVWALGFIVAGLVASSAVAWQLHALSRRWERLQAERAAVTRTALDRRMAAMVAAGTQTATDAAEAATEDTDLFTRLEQLQRRSNVDAVAVFGQSDSLAAWAGEHRGRVPTEVRHGAHSVWFSEGPLYSYLYFTAPLRANRGTAIVAILLDAALPAETNSPGVVPQIEALAGRDAAFLPGPGAPTDWHLVLSGDTLLHARLDPITQLEWRTELVKLAQRVLLMLVLAALVLIASAWFRETARPRTLRALLPFLGTCAVLFVAPLGSALGLENLFSPALFLLPGPGEVSLGPFLVVLLTAGLFVSTTRLRARFRNTLVFVVGVVAFTALLPFAIQLLIGPAPTRWARLASASADLLESNGNLWFGLQLALTLLVGMISTLLLTLPRWPAAWDALTRHRAALFLVTLSAALAGIFGFAALLAAQKVQHLNPMFAIFWSIPLLVAGYGAAAYQTEGRRIVRWLLSCWIAATLGLPYIWSAQVWTRLRVAEGELATLGNAPDPYLEYLLKQFGQEAIARRELGEDSLQLLYRSWVNSGLAREAVPARITLWDGQGKPQMQLPLGDAFSSAAERLETIPDYLAETFVRVQELAHPEVFRAHDVDDVNQMLVVPLDQNRMVTVEVPPRRTFERASVIAPLLGARADLTTRLELVPSTSITPGGVWRPTEDGWRSEAHVRFPDGDYHAHLRVRLPKLGVLVARGVLLIAGDVLVFVLLWLAGRALRGETVAPVGGWLSVVGSFRARITVALLAFFLLPTALFGLVAYRALAREVERAARIVAERAVQQAVIEFPESRGNLRELSAHAGEEILQFFAGELINVSSPEALELGVYNAWLPSNVAATLASGEAEADVATRQIGEQEFLTAYRRLQVRNTGVMAVPVSLESAETVIRQREMAHLILFAALVGGLLSLALSVAVGRALARPMGRLQRAAAAVGRGRLRVRLPEHTRDEFGQLFASFNRMVRRLQRARAQELRTARVLAWGEMARQVAHEIKNPLTPIKLSVQHLRRAHADGRADFGDILERSVDQILIEIDRLTEIARAFSRYGAPGESAGPLEAVSVEAVAHEALTLYRTGDPQLRYDDDIEATLPAVLARSGELKEVILNLLENARNATPAGGRIAVVAHRQNGAVELCVQDNGIGIPPDLLNRVFEPHFSTRTTGTGLGLPIVRRLVESWGGAVTAESEAGRGTTIRVRLQIAALISD